MQASDAVESMAAVRAASKGELEALTVEWQNGRNAEPFCYSPSQQGISVCAPAGWVEMNVQQRQLVSGNLQAYKKEKVMQQREADFQKDCTFLPQTNGVLRTLSSNQLVQ
jgi:hypothetical protein